ncbi:MAG: hypothetical protein C5B49_01340 [Bdellovibrio sp.]|nr:MAG: hypothetical protein C5B49_01340 [Bdellovibrio sp.]
MKPSQLMTGKIRAAASFMALPMILAANVSSAHEADLAKELPQGGNSVITGTVACTDAKTGAAALSFKINATKSARLGSDLTAATGTIVQASVAQYYVDANNIDILADDAAGNPTFEFSAFRKRNQTTLTGTIRTFNNGGQVANTERVNCTVTQ